MRLVPLRHRSGYHMGTKSLPWQQHSSGVPGVDIVLWCESPLVHSQGGTPHFWTPPFPRRYSRNGKSLVGVRVKDDICKWETGTQGIHGKQDPGFLYQKSNFSTSHLHNTKSISDNKWLQTNLLTISIVSTCTNTFLQGQILTQLDFSVWSQGSHIPGNLLHFRGKFLRFTEIGYMYRRNGGNSNLLCLAKNIQMYSRPATQRLQFAE